MLSPCPDKWTTPCPKGCPYLSECTSKVRQKQEILESAARARLKTAVVFYPEDQTQKDSDK